MKRIIPILIFILIIKLDINAQFNILEDIKNQVEIDSLLKYVEELSGVVPVIVNGQQYTISSRHKNYPTNDIAAEYLFEKLVSYGLDVEYDQFSSTGSNVIATQNGTDFPNQYFIVCAHFDSMPSSANAPGADDNASGTAAVIEAARILTQYSLPYSVKYCLWDEEEQGLIGSDHYATSAAAAGDDIMGVLNMDMIAYDGNGDNKVDIHTRSTGNSYELSDKLLELNSTLNIGLITNILDPGSSYSDHASFWSQGYGAILLIEEDNDFNPYYHTSNDKIIYFSNEIFEKSSELIISGLASFALNLNINIIHEPYESIQQPQEIVITAQIQSGLEIGSGINAPHIHYRTSNGGNFSIFYNVPGEELNTDSGIYQFTIPVQPLGTIVQYYIAAQDENSSLVTTLPKGGSGFSPPGSTPPQNFFQFFVAPLNTVLSDEFITFNNWVSTGSWGLTTTKFVSSPNSVTDSPTGNYSTNTNASITTTDFLEFEDALGAELTFSAQWEIEAGWDYAQVLISLDGADWEPLNGLYTKPGSGSFQPIGEPLYDGSQTTWIEEKIDLSDYVNEPFKIRFSLRSDGYINEDGIYIDDVKINIYGATPANTVCADINLMTGWNLVSVPVNNSSMMLDQIFPNAISQAFYFDDYYRMTEELSNDFGYWIKFNAPESIQLCGDKIDDVIIASEGWNLIGGNDSSVSVNGISSVPSGIIETNFFSFNNGYIVSNIIEPGKGYWVRLSEPGQLKLFGATEKTNDNLLIEDNDNITLKVTSNRSGNSTLFITSKEKDLDRFELPPLPPKEVFDARFTSNGFVENINNSPEIVFSGIYDFLELEVFGSDIQITSPETGRIIVKEGEKTVISNDVKSVVITSVSIPKYYELSQNYPNPFNPSTKIKFALPEISNVIVKVFNIVGQEVAILVNGELESGLHEINFNASNLPTGVYFYTIEAKGAEGENFTETKKMMLIK